MDLAKSLGAGGDRSPWVRCVIVIPLINVRSLPFRGGDNAWFWRILTKCIAHSDNGHRDMDCLIVVAGSPRYLIYHYPLHHRCFDHCSLTQNLRRSHALLEGVESCRRRRRTFCQGMEPKSRIRPISRRRVQRGRFYFPSQTSN